MLQITQKRIDLSRSEVLYSKPFTEDGLHAEWEISGGAWHVDGEWLTGYFDRNAGGLVYLYEKFPGDVMLDFRGRTVPPCKNDLNFSFCTEGWDYERGDAARGYIAGLGGWWEDKTGIEHYPTCRPWAGTTLFPVEAGRTYHIQAGCIGGHCFIFVDGKLVIEMQDDTYGQKLLDCQRVGLGTYCSHVQFTDFKVIRPVWEPLHMTYTHKP